MKKTILAIGTHPDDIEIGCGGTLSVLKARGHEIVYVIVTSGEEGSLHLKKKKLAETREEEALKSAEKLGAAKVIFLREADGLVSYSKELKIRMIQVLREIKPDLIFTHAGSDSFPDHQVVHRLTLAAIIGAQGPWYSDAGGTPHSVQELYGYEVWNAMPQYQMAIDITPFIQQKLELVRCHFSQIDAVNYLDAIEGLAKYRGVMSMTAKYAEVFEVLKTRGIQ